MSSLLKVALQRVAKMRNLVAYALLIAVSVFQLWHFIMIWRLGQFYIQEPNTNILIAETIAVGGIVVYGLYMAIRWAK